MNLFTTKREYHNYINKNAPHTSKMADEKSGSNGVNPTVVVMQQDEQFSESLDNEASSIEEMITRLKEMQTSKNAYDKKRAELRAQIETSNDELRTKKKEKTEMVAEQVRLANLSKEGFQKIHDLEEGINKLYGALETAHAEVRSETVIEKGSNKTRDAELIETAYELRTIALAEYNTAIDDAAIPQRLEEIKTLKERVIENGKYMKQLDEDIIEANTERETYATELTELKNTTGQTLSGKKAKIGALLGNVGYQLAAPEQEYLQMTGQVEEPQPEDVIDAVYEETTDDGESDEEEIPIVDGTDELADDEEEFVISDDDEEGDEEVEAPEEEIPVELVEPAEELTTLDEPTGTSDNEGLFSEIDAGRPSIEIDAPFGEGSRTSQTGMLDGLVGERREDSVVFAAISREDSGTSDIEALNLEEPRDSSIPSPNLSNFDIQEKYGITDKVASIQKHAAKVYKKVISPSLKSEKGKHTSFNIFRTSLMSEDKKSFRYAGTAKKYNVTSFEADYNPKDEIHTLRAQSFCYAILGLMNATNHGLKSEEAYIRIEELTTELFDTYNLELEKNISGKVPSEITANVNDKRRRDKHRNADLSGLFEDKTQMKEKKHRSLIIGYNSLNAMVDLLSELTNPTYVAEVLEGKIHDHVPSGQYEDESLQITCYKTIERLTRDNMKEKTGTFKTAADKRALTLAVNRYKRTQEKK